MHELTTYQWLYIFELTAPVFYRIKRGYIRDAEEKKVFSHFEEMEIPHAPWIKDFLRKYNKGVFPIPKLIEIGAVCFSHLVCLFGKKAIYYFEYLFEKEAVHVYGKLINNTKDEELKIFSIKLRDEEIPHLEYFKKKLGKTS